MSFVPIAALVIAAPLAWLLMPLGIRVAWATGWLDHPQARKLHKHATAVLGGAVVFVSAVIAWAITLFFTPHSPADWEAWYLLAGAATMLISAGLMPHIGLPVGIEAALTLVALVALMNAVNFLDNMNGMVGGIAPIAFLGFAWMSLERGANGIAAAQLALAGACIGFL